MDALSHLRFKLTVFNNWDQRGKTMTISMNRCQSNPREPQDREMPRIWHRYNHLPQREVSKCSLRDRKGQNNKNLKRMQYSRRTTDPIGKMKSLNQGHLRLQILSYLTSRRSYKISLFLKETYHSSSILVEESLRISSFQETWPNSTAEREAS